MHLNTLKQRILAHGPLSIADFMAEALAYYYGSRDPLGQQGDFTTAPEISQLFGEMLGIWCAYSWQQMGCPDKVMLIELGPGRGTLMADMLRATLHVSGFHAALTVHLVETSPSLRKRQEEALRGYPFFFHNDISSVPEGDFILVANEFFDALPIHQYQKTPKGWSERRLALTADDTPSFMLTPLPALIAQQLDSEHPQAAEGAILETCPAGIAIIRELASRMARKNGVALVIDYGYDFPTDTRPYHDTLQAVKAHHYVPVLDHIGEADITAHVDFSALKTASQMEGATAYGTVSQQQLLEALGIHLRMEQLCQKATPAQQHMLRSGVERLTSPTAMGTLFKAIAITSPNHPYPAGFTL